MKFKKGTSGNPGGRPKKLLPDGRSLIDIAKEHTVQAVDTLVEVMSDSAAPHPSRVSAATALLDRGWGRPKQEFAGEVDLKVELPAIIETARKRVGDAKS